MVTPILFRIFASENHSKKVMDIKYKKFNVFGNDGRNHVITEDKPMTSTEVLYKYKWALCVGGIE